MKRKYVDTWQAFKRLTRIGFPQHFQIVQFPNLLLIAASITGYASRNVGGAAHNYLQTTAYMTMTVWAYEEIVSGSNWFRRLLGTFFMIVVLLHITHR